MSLDILDAISKISPILTRMSGAGAAAQDQNAIIGNNAANDRPSIVGKNLSNSRLASMFSGYTKPKLQWGGPGSVARGGAMPTMSGGFGPDSPETSALEQEVQKDALAQAKNNYGIKDPSASSAGDKVLGTAGEITSILGALKGLGKGSSATPANAAVTSGPTSGSTVARPTGGLPPVTGAPSRGGMDSGIPGYFLNPDGTLVAIAGDPANSGQYGGGLFPVNSDDVNNPNEPHD